jgi:ketosteroid isomerase-like protein
MHASTAAHFELGYCECAEMGHVMDRASVEKIVREAYAARQRGDLEATCQHFCDDAQFAVMGSPEASPVAMQANRSDGIREALGGLIAAVDFVEHEVLAVIVEGDRAAVHSRVRMRAKATSNEAVTEMVELVRLQDWKIASFQQFCDTAVASRLLGDFQFTGRAAPSFKGPEQA